ncbi:glycoside hydrolase family 5 protein [Hypoxylon sp. FL0890]|nr:glycoside hydrolase family 5 protein [Hypoxylon sp. FL0890]
MILTLSSLLSLGLLASGGSALKDKYRATPEGFVDGKDVNFAGSNAYYFPFDSNATDIKLALAAAKDVGLKVFRTWGSNDKNSMYDPQGLLQYGSERAVNAATKVGIKLIVTLTNNWADYGGMGYTINLGRNSHDDATSKPPSLPGGNCTVDTLTSWIDGGDFDANLAMSNIDFGWVRDHAAAGKKAGKPVVHEEYGWMTPEACAQNQISAVNATRMEAEGGWQRIMLEEQMSDMY